MLAAASLVERMALVLKLPPVVESGELFMVSIASSEDRAVDLTLTVRGAEREFALDERPLATSHRVEVRSADLVTYVISSWGRADRGDRIVVTAALTASNAATVS